MTDEEKLKKYETEIGLIYFLVSKFSGQITKTRLLKLFYLIDSFANEKLKKKITQFSYDFYYYGPFSETFIDLLNFSNGFEVLETIKNHNDDEVIYLYSKGIKPRIKDVSSLLSEKQNQVIGEVVNKYASLPFKELLEVVYKTQPMRNKSFGAKNIL